MKKLLLTLLFTSCCFAEYVCDPCNPCDETDPCDGCSPCMPCEQPCPVFSPPPKPQDCGYAAPYLTQVACSSKLFVTASFLYWEVKQDNMELGHLYTHCIPLPSAPVQVDKRDEKIQSLKWNYRPGFKVGAGFNFDCDRWQLYGEYTYYHANTCGTMSLPNPSYDVVDDFEKINWLQPSWTNECLSQIALDSPENTEVLVVAGDGRWTVQLDLGDLELARKFYVGKCLIFRAFSALRYASIQQTMSVSHQINTSDTDFMALFEPEGIVQYNITHKLQSWGIGPRVGLDLLWELSCGFRIFCDSSASILYTEYYKNTHSTSAEGTVYSGTTVPLDYNCTSTHTFDKDPCTLKSQAEITLGLGWGGYLNCSRWYLDFELGYTANMFFDQNQFLQQLNQTYYGATQYSNLVARGGNLIFHGLTATAKLDF